MSLLGGMWQACFGRRRRACYKSALNLNEQQCICYKAPESALANHGVFWRRDGLQEAVQGTACVCSATNEDAQRAALTLSATPACFTIVSFDGRQALFQNVTSKRWLGERTQRDPPGSRQASAAQGMLPAKVRFYTRGKLAALSLIRGKTVGDRRTPVPASTDGQEASQLTGLAEVKLVTQADDLLALIFQHEPDALARLRNELTNEGDIWKGIVRVPVFMGTDSGACASEDGKVWQSRGANAVVAPMAAVPEISPALPPPPPTTLRSPPPPSLQSPPPLPPSRLMATAPAVTAAAAAAEALAVPSRPASSAQLANGRFSLEVSVASQMGRMRKFLRRMSRGSFDVLLHTRESCGPASNVARSRGSVEAVGVVTLARNEGCASAVFESEPGRPGCASIRRGSGFMRPAGQEGSLPLKDVMMDMLLEEGQSLQTALRPPSLRSSVNPFSASPVSGLADGSSSGMVMGRQGTRSTGTASTCNAFQLPSDEVGPMSAVQRPRRRESVESDGDGRGTAGGTRQSPALAAAGGWDRSGGGESLSRLHQRAYPNLDAFATGSTRPRRDTTSTNTLSTSTLALSLTHRGILSTAPALESAAVAAAAEALGLNKGEDGTGRAIGRRKAVRRVASCYEKNTAGLGDDEDEDGAPPKAIVGSMPEVSALGPASAASRKISFDRGIRGGLEPHAGIANSARLLTFAAHLKSAPMAAQMLARVKTTQGSNTIIGPQQQPQQPQPQSAIQPANPGSAAADSLSGAPAAAASVPTGEGVDAVALQDGAQRTASVPCLAAAGMGMQQCIRPSSLPAASASASAQWTQSAVGRFLGLSNLGSRTDSAGPSEAATDGSAAGGTVGGVSGGGRAGSAASGRGPGGGGGTGGGAGDLTSENHSSLRRDEDSMSSFLLLPGSSAGRILQSSSSMAPPYGSSASTLRLEPWFRPAAHMQPELQRTVGSSTEGRSSVSFSTTVNASTAVNNAVTTAAANTGPANSLLTGQNRMMLCGTGFWTSLDPSARPESSQQPTSSIISSFYAQMHTMAGATSLNGPSSLQPSANLSMGPSTSTNSERRTHAGSRGAAATAVAAPAAVTPPGDTCLHPLMPTFSLKPALAEEGSWSSRGEPAKAQAEGAGVRAIPVLVACGDGGGGGAASKVPQPSTTAMNATMRSTAAAMGAEAAASAGGGIAGGGSGCDGGSPEDLLVELRRDGIGEPYGGADDGSLGRKPRMADGVIGLLRQALASQDCAGSRRNSRDECWHEIWATRALDPVTQQPVVVLVQHDVTAKVIAERHLALVMETEHRLLEQLFPRHILAYITEDFVAKVAAAAAAGGSNSNMVDAQWRPTVRDCNALATWHPQVTLLFADIKGFTPMCKEVEPSSVMGMLNDLYSRYDKMLDQYGVFKVETIGDCYFVAGGLIHEDEDGMTAVRDGGRTDPLHAERVFAFAQAMLAAAQEVLMPSTRKPVQIRIGIHSGPVVSGVVGTRMPRFCLFGDTVNTASRMESSGTPGTIHASEATFQLLRNSAAWRPTGGIEVKGKGLMQTYLHVPSPGPSLESSRPSLPAFPPPSSPPPLASPLAPPPPQLSPSPPSPGSPAALPCASSTEHLLPDAPDAASHESFKGEDTKSTGSEGPTDTYATYTDLVTAAGPLAAAMASGSISASASCKAAMTLGDLCSDRSHVAVDEPQSLYDSVSDGFARASFGGFPRAQADSCDRSSTPPVTTRVSVLRTLSELGLADATLALLGGAEGLPSAAKDWGPEFEFEYASGDGGRDGGRDGETEAVESRGTKPKVGSAGAVY